MTRFLHQRFLGQYCLLLLAISGIAPGWGNAQEAGQAIPTTATATATANSRQIRVEADDHAIQAAFTNFADKLHREFRQMLHEPDDAWAFPIEIKVSGTAHDVVDGPTAVTDVEILLDGNFQLQLFVRLHNRYDQIEVNRRFIQLLLYEMMVRPYAGKNETFQGKKLQVPPWLIRGIDELIKHRASGRPSDLFAGIVKSRKVLPVSEILAQTGDQMLDPVTDSIFGASSAALVAALLDQENGSESFRSYLIELTSPDSQGSENSSAQLRQQFPGLRGSSGALEKWWSLQIASMGQLQAFEFLDAAQTETALTEALLIEVPAEEAKQAEGFRKLLPHAKPKPGYSGRIHDFDDFLDHENATAALQDCRMKLRTLGLRAFPLYRGVILRYEMAVLNLIEGRTRGMDDELKKVDVEREGIQRSMGRVEDYMNYFEATQAEGTSEAYEQYRQMKEKLERQGRPQRSDRISKYLDALEREYDTR